VIPELQRVVDVFLHRCEQRSASAERGVVRALCKLISFELNA
jgi:hypothetical protein